MSCEHVRQEMPYVKAEDCKYGNEIPAESLPCATPGCPSGVLGDGLKFMGPTPLHYIYLDRAHADDGWRWVSRYAGTCHGDAEVWWWGDKPVDTVTA